MKINYTNYLKGKEQLQDEAKKAEIIPILKEALKKEDIHGKVTLEWYLTAVKVCIDEEYYNMFSYEEKAFFKGAVGDCRALNDRTDEMEGKEAETAAKEIVEEIGENQAAGLVEYANLVKQLAENLTEEELESTDTFKKVLKGKLGDWEREQWYDLLKAVRCWKRSTEHEEQTAEKIFQEMQFSARVAANEAVFQLLGAAAGCRLHSLNKATDNTVAILWKIFYCCVADIKKSIVRLNRTIKPFSSSDEQNHKRLLYFIEVLREKLWERGEVLKLREIE